MGDVGDRAVARATAVADLVVVGAGVAGLTAALGAAAAGLRVVLMQKGPSWRADRTEQSTSTFYAQGGVAVVIPADVDGVMQASAPGRDSVELHLADSIAAGAGLTDAAAARGILADGWRAVATLIDRGADFDRDGAGLLARTREGGHSMRRILHIGGDATGAGIARALGAALSAACDRGDIVCLDEAYVTSILCDTHGRVTGVRYLAAGVSSQVRAPTVLLATGGAGHLYPATTNPAGATADGVALALRAGASVSDLEFIQFHPTMLYTPGERGRRALITEALRGEGARLVDVAGRSVTAGVHPLGDLAPRDVVANAVVDSIERTQHPCVFLDVSQVADIEDRFPTVTAALRAAGLGVGERIPVVPGAHYLCGGVVTDAMTRTGVEGLLAAGEVARTGLHGANRLASNSLLEALVMGMRAAVSAVSGREGQRGVTAADDAREGTAAARTTVQDVMGRYVGLRRDAAGLAEAAALLAAAPTVPLLTTAAAEDSALTMTAAAVVAAALARTESRGSHVRTDFPDEGAPYSTVFGLRDGQIVQRTAAGTANHLG